MSGPRFIESAFGAEIVIDGRSYVNFAGSSYLGLAGRTEILEAGAAALYASGSGYQLARQYNIRASGYEWAEHEAAGYFGTEAALFLAGGYYFGLVAFAGLRKEFQQVFVDERSHHCLMDGIAAAGLHLNTYRHLDVEDLRQTLRATLRHGDKPLIVTDGMYSTFGEIAPLDGIAELVREFQGKMVVDESHSFGILGATGRGTVEHFELEPELVLAGGSTGKAFGVVGGLVPGSYEEIDRLRDTHASRGASHGLPAAGAMCAASLRYIRRHPELLQRLRENTRRLKSGVRQLGLPVSDSVAPVVTLVIPGMKELHSRLWADGIYVLHSNYIGTVEGGALRCAVFADHTVEHIDRLLEALRRWFS